MRIAVFFLLLLTACGGGEVSSSISATASEVGRTATAYRPAVVPERETVRSRARYLLLINSERQVVELYERPRAQNGYIPHYGHPARMPVPSDLPEMVVVGRVRGIDTDRRLFSIDWISQPRWRTRIRGVEMVSSGPLQPAGEVLIPDYVFDVLVRRMGGKRGAREALRLGVDVIAYRSTLSVLP